MRLNILKQKSTLIAPVIFAISISIFTIATLVIIATTSLDAKDIKASKLMINTSLVSLQDNLDKLNYENIMWPEAIRKIYDDQDWAWAEENIGNYLAAIYNISVVFNVDKNGKTVMGFLDGKPSKTDAHAFFGQQLNRLIKDAWIKMDYTTGAKFGYSYPEPQHGFIKHNEDAYIISVCAFTPSSADLEYVPTPRPILVLGRKIDASVLSWIARMTQIESLASVSISKWLDGPYLDIKNTDGKVISRLAWDRPSDGRKLLMAILPAIIIALIGVGWFTRKFLKKELETRQKTEEILLKAKTELEERVEERTEQLLESTLQLRETNINLENEIQLRSQIEKEILVISEREQRNIGQEIHDGLCQQMTGILYLCSVIEENLEKQSTTELESMKKVVGLMEEAIDQARDLSHGICPISLDPASLSASIQELAHKMNQVYHIECEYNFTGWNQPPDSTTALHLFRIVQESLNNIVKHAKATEVNIRMGEDYQGYLNLMITDNGSGIKEQEQVGKRGMGLKIMAYRTKIIGGEFDIAPLSGGGTMISCRIPVREESENE